MLRAIPQCSTSTYFESKLSAYVFLLIFLTDFYFLGWDRIISDHNHVTKNAMFISGSK